MIYVTNSALSNDRIILPKSQVSHHSLAQESFSMPRPLTNTPRDTVLSLQEAKSLYQMIVNTVHYHISQINEIRIFGNCSHSKLGLQDPPCIVTEDQLQVILWFYQWQINLCARVFKNSFDIISPSYIKVR